MADIAILVAEEYEKREKKTAEEKASPVMVHLRDLPATAKKKMIESFEKKFEAKSQFALAASSCSFSA
ncbi:PREDICTED: uncharacterized protein LOC109116285 [Tarenaya hassleriana]|uniref:uncharacterized protein LOC109116285 n=1 Tax=Tarenaya hassleriana TaxID=28532 RepID=UPI0008FD7FD6|nr:PREDICTED: uncharacterized protein LOC109116285 [Tarenaya hassleriana]